MSVSHIHTHHLKLFFFKTKFRIYLNIYTVIQKFGVSFLKEIKSFIQKGCIKLVIKVTVQNISSSLLNCSFITES